MGIYLIKKKPAKLLERLCEKPISDVGISSITYSELEYGVCKSLQQARNRSALIRFLTPFEVADYDDRAAVDYGSIRSDLEFRGEPIGSMDMLIAAHARSLGCTLVTNNTREFGRVSGLKVENWAG